MEITVSTRGTWTVLTQAGTIAGAGPTELRENLLPPMTGNLVALDFTAVESVTSAAFPRS